MTAALVAFALVIGLSFFGVRIAFAALLVGFGGVALERGVNAAFTMLGQQVLEDAMNYNLSVIPLFVLMGTFIYRSGISADLFKTANQALSRVSGRLAHSTILACAGFSAVCGSSLATAATMSKVCIPPMRQFGYSRSLASGAVAAGGTLGIMIPPSVPLVIYGLIAQQDIADLFLAGVVPGLLLVLSFLIVITLWVAFFPNAAPKMAKASDPATLPDPEAVVPPEDDAPQPKRALFSVLAVLGLFILVLGGIYGRIFTPTEASGIGAVGAAIIALSRGHLLNLGEWIDALSETVVTTASLFMVLFGALVFLQYITLTGMPYDLLFWVDDMNLSPFLLVLMVIALALVMGTVFEAIGILLLLVPVFLPALEASGVDLIWFGILVVLVIEMGLITPPIGMNVFVVKSISQDIEISKIFQGVLPFILAMFFVLTALLVVPDIVLFLIE